MDIQKHNLVPKHEILLEDEVEEIFAELDYNKENLPKISEKDPVSKEIGAKVGDVLRITRNSQTRDSTEKTIESSITYRLVI